MRRRTSILVVASMALPFLPRVARSESPNRLRPGVFLYSAPHLRDPNFVETVVLLVQHEDEGSMGLVVNRPTRIPVGEAVDRLGEVPGLELRLYRGGPVQPEAILALVRSARPVPDARRVLPDVHLSGDMDQVTAIAKGPEAQSRLRVYSGYAGWSPGQLAEEVRGGGWVIGPADALSVFTSDPSRLWPRVHDLMRRIEVRASASGELHARDLRPDLRALLAPGPLETEAEVVLSLDLRRSR